MAREVQQHPAGIVELGSASDRPGVMNLVIPRLRKTVAQSLRTNNSQSVPLQHYTGPKKVKPRAVSISSGIRYTDACARAVLTGDYEWEGMSAFRMVTASLLQHCLQCKW